MLSSAYRTVAALRLPGLEDGAGAGGGTGAVSRSDWCGLAQLAGHCVLGAVYVVVHSAVHFVQVVCLSIAVNSSSTALLPMLVSSNFVELKSGVFKRFKP